MGNTSGLRALVLFIVASWLALHPASVPVFGDEPLTTVAAVLELPASEAARGYHVDLTGTVTYNDSCGCAFVENGGRYICASGLPDLSIGSRIRLRGFTDRGDVNNVIRQIDTELLGIDALPEPIEVQAEDVNLTKHDCSLIRTQAVITSVRVGSHNTYYGATSGETKFEIALPNVVTYEEAVPVVGATIECVGNVAIHSQGDILNKFRLLCQRSNVRRIAASVEPLVAVPIRTRDQLWHDRTARQFRLSGQVTANCGVSGFFVERDRAGAWINNPAGIRVSVGDLVEVAGTRELQAVGGRLNGLILVRTGEGPLPTPELLDRPVRDSEKNRQRRIRVRGRLISHEYDGDHGKLIVQAYSERFECRVFTDAQHFNSLDPATVSELTVTGTCSFDEREGIDFVLHVPVPTDVVIESRQLRLERAEAVAIFAILGGALAACLLWGWTMWVQLVGKRRDLDRLSAELRMSFDTIEDAVLVVDADCTVAHVNDRFRAIVGQNLVAGDSLDALDDLFSSSSGTSDFFRHWMRLRPNAEKRPDDSLSGLRLEFGPPNPRTLEAITSPICEHSDRMIGRLWVFRDVSERTQLKEQLFHAQKQEAIGQLAGGFAHDFNNILTGIIGSLMIATVDRSRTIDDTMEPLSVALDASQRASELVAKLLVFSRKTPLELKSNDVNAVIRKMIALLQPTVKGNVEIVVDLATDLPYVLCDSTLLEQAFLNICLNACDAIRDNGRVTVQSRFVESLSTPVSDQGGDEICILITDDGHGMEPETAARIFEPYFTTRATNGTGLGLPMAEAIVQQHGGTIKCRSTPGEGTRFLISLPASRQISASGLQDNGVKGESPVGESLAGRTVMVIDDEDMVRDAITSLLTANGAHVLPVARGADALQLIEQQEDIDIVLLDWTMPEMSGQETLQRIKMIHPALPTIVCSGRVVDPDDLPDGGSVRPDAVLRKPFALRNICDEINEVIAVADRS